MGEHKMTVPGGLGTSAQIIPFRSDLDPRLARQRELVRESVEIDAGYPTDPTIILSMDGKEPA